MTPEREELFERVFKAEGEKIYRWIYRRCGNRQLGEDITSECFIRAFERYEGSENDLTRILYRVADNLLTDHFRSKIRQERFAQRIRKESLEASVATPESEIVERQEEVYVQETARRVRSILSESDRLNESHKRCLAMRLLENKMPKQIAVELSTDYVQVKNLLQYGLKILKEELRSAKS